MPKIMDRLYNWMQLDFSMHFAIWLWTYHIVGYKFQYIPYCIPVKCLALYLHEVVQVGQDFPVFSHAFRWFSHPVHVCPMFLRFSHPFPMDFHMMFTFSHAFLILFPCFSYSCPIVFLWFFLWFAMFFLWLSYGFPMVFLWLSYGFPCFFYGFLHGFPTKPLAKKFAGLHRLRLANSATSWAPQRRKGGWQT
jgi:hypothetical protein